MFLIGLREARRAFQYFITGEEFVVFEFDGADFILCALRDHKAERHVLGVLVIKLHIFQLEIDVAFVAIKIRELILVLFELLVFEHTTAGNPGEHPMTARLDHLTKSLLGKGLCGDKIHFHNFDFGRFFNFERDLAPPGLLIDARHCFDLGPLVTGFFVELLDLAAIFKQLLFAQRLARLGSNFLPQFRGAVLFVSLETNISDRWFALDHVDEIDFPSGNRFLRDAHIVEQTGAHQGNDIVIHAVATVSVAGLHPDIRANQSVAGSGRTHMADFNFLHLRPRPDLSDDWQRAKLQTKKKKSPERPGAAKEKFHRRTLSLHVFIADFCGTFKARN